MKKAIKSLAAAVVLAAASAFPSIAHAQENPGKTDLFTWTADAIFDTDTIHQISDERAFYPDNEIAGGNVTSIKSVSCPSQYITGKINWIKDGMRYGNPKVTRWFTSASAEREIEHLETLRSYFEKVQKIPAWIESEKKLSKDLSDWMLTPEELKGLETGLPYILDKRGIENTNTGEGYDVPYIFTTVAPSQYAQKKELSESEIEKIVGKTVETYLQKEKERKAAKKAALKPSYEKPSKGLPLSLVLGTSYSTNENSVGAIIGGKWGYSDDLVNLALSGIYQKGLSGETSTSAGPVSPAGLYGQGISTSGDFQSFGADASLYVGNKNIRGVIGGGISFESYTNNLTSQVLRSGVVLASNNASQPRNDVLVRGYVGASTKYGELDIGLEHSLNSGKNDLFLSFQYDLGQKSNHN